MSTHGITAQNAGSPLVKRGAPLWAVTTVAAMAQLMIILDERVVNVALPSIRADLGMNADALQWVITAYLVTFGGLLLLAARLNDLRGRRRMLIAGLVVFTVASLAAGCARSGLELIAARFLQGIGGAILAPASLSLIAAVYTDLPARRRAMGVWAMVTSAGAVAGVVLGGVLTSALGWRSVMFVNVPVGALLIVAAVAVLTPSSRLPRSEGQVDIAGAALVTAGIAAVIYGISAGPDDGWASARVIAALGGAIALLAVFFVVESRTASPLLHLALFRIETVRNANLGLLGFGAVLTASLYFLSLYLQLVDHYTALETGLALVPMSVLLGVGSILSPRLMAAGMRMLPVYGSVAAAGRSAVARVPSCRRHLRGSPARPDAADRCRLRCDPRAACLRGDDRSGADPHRNSLRHAQRLTAGRRRRGARGRRQHRHRDRRHRRHGSTHRLPGGLRPLRAPRPPHRRHRRSPPHRAPLISGADRGIRVTRRGGPRRCVATG